MVGVCVRTFSQSPTEAGLAFSFSIYLLLAAIPYEFSELACWVSLSLGRHFREGNRNRVFLWRQSFLPANLVCLPPPPSSLLPLHVFVMRLDIPGRRLRCSVGEEATLDVYTEFRLYCFITEQSFRVFHPAEMRKLSSQHTKHTHTIWIDLLRFMAHDCIKPTWFKNRKVTRTNV